MSRVTKDPRNQVVGLDGSPSVQFIIGGNAANALGLIVARALLSKRYRPGEQTSSGRLGMFEKRQERKW
jgi:hypothetical protein